MSRVLRARLGYLFGLALAAAGAALVFGLGWGLMVGGLGVVVACVWLYDVAEPERPVRFRSREE